VREVRKLLPWVWTGLVGTVFILILVFGGGGEDSVDYVLGIVSGLVIVLIAGFGALISSRQPGNRIAWLFQTISVLFLVVLPASVIVGAIDPTSPGFPDGWDYIAILIVDGISLGLFHAVFLLLYIFPTGRFLTPRWSWVGWSLVVLASASFLTLLFTEELTESFVDDPWRIPNPIGFLPSNVSEFVSSTWAYVLMVVAVGGVASMIVRYRRSDIVVRTQIKWVLYAAVIAAVCLPIGFGEFAGAGLVLSVALLIIPTVITIAITRYNLYEIDRLISRTLSYAILVGVLGLVYVAGAVWLPTRLLGDTVPTLFVAGSTLAVAALFNPLRRRIQQAVDRRFNRSSYQAEAIAESFSAKLQESLTVKEVAEAWSRTVEEALQPEAAGIWIKTPTTRQTPESSTAP